MNMLVFFGKQTWQPSEYMYLRRQRTIISINMRVLKLPGKVTWLKRGLCNVTEVRKLEKERQTRTLQNSSTLKIKGKSKRNLCVHLWRKQLSLPSDPPSVVSRRTYSPCCIIMAYIINIVYILIIPMTYSTCFLSL